MEDHPGAVHVCIVIFLISQPVLILLYIVGLFPFDFFYVFTPILLVGLYFVPGIYIIEIVKSLINLCRRKRNQH